ncbi:MAG: type VI secretion system tube protein Hcp [Candidatus Nanopelagicales bacterium]
MAERWFLKVDGIPGESTHIAHKGEIEVDSWTWGVTHQGALYAGGGGGVGKASLSDLSVVTSISAASPVLLNACVSGSHFKQATLSGVRTGGKGADFVRYRLSDVMVTAVQHADTGSDEPTEQLAFTYAKVEVTYTPQAPSGQPGTPVVFAYDVKANKPI